MARKIKLGKTERAIIGYLYKAGASSEISIRRGIRRRSSVHGELNTLKKKGMITIYSYGNNVYEITPKARSWMFKTLPQKKIEDRLPGGLADKYEINEFNFNQMQKGIDIELEHTNDPELSAEIASDHLEEIPDYYDYLEEMEEEAEDKWEERERRRMLRQLSSLTRE